MEPMGKKEIQAKIAKRKEKELFWNTVISVAILIPLWFLITVISVNVLIEFYSVLVQDMDKVGKIGHVLGQQWPLMVAWLVVFYSIRAENRKLGW